VRLFSALAFLLSAYIYKDKDNKWLPKAALSKTALLIIALGVPALVLIGITFYPSHVPDAFINGVGLTPLKIYSEYLIVCLLFLASAAYWKRMKRSGDGLLMYYVAAFIISGFSELVFTAYKIDFDIHNVLGHIYKVAAFCLIYVGIFVSSVKDPYLERKHAEEALRKSKEELELRVEERTVELRKGNVQLRIELTEREKAEDALRQSEERYRALFSSMTEGFALHEIICDQKGEPFDYRFLDINPAFEKLTGLKRENVVGRTHNEILPDDDPRLVRAYSAVALTGEPTHFENYSPALKKHFEVFAYRPESGQFAVLFRDITERKKADEENRSLLAVVQEEKDRLSALVNSIQDEVWFADKRKVFTLVNPSALREFGLDTVDGIDVEKLAGSLEVYRADGSPRPVEEAPPLRALQGDMVRSQEELIRTPRTGELRHREISASPVRDASGTVIGSVSVVRDITERKRMETALRESEERYHNLFNTMDEGFCVIEMIFDGENRPVDYRFLEVNAAFEKQTGLHDAEGKLMRDLASDHEEHWFEIYGKIALTGEPIHFGNEAKALNRWFDVYAYRVGNPEDRQVAIIFNDITDRKRIEENLRSAHDDLEVRIQERTFELSEAYETLQKEADEHKKTAEHLVRIQKLEALGTLAGGIAHDFNNVLAGVIGFTEMVLEDIAPDTPEHRRLELALKGANRGRDLVRQILTFSRKSEQDKKPLALNQIIEEGLKLLRPMLPTTIEIVSKSLTNDDQIFADPVQMHQILMNLCTNAAHAMREKGGTLDIRVFKTSLQEGNPMPLPNINAGEYVILKVSDTGSGMTPETLNQVFDPFFTTKQPGEGTGLGLSVVHGIIKSHDGYIAVESEAGKGTTFHVYFPRIKEEERSIDKETLLVAGGKERILIVDDEDMLVELNEQRLRRLGYEVVATTSSMEALAIFRKEPDTFDLVITDYTMPNLTGIDLAMELLKVRATIPIILCTGQSDAVSPEKARKIGIRGFLVKPLANRELAQAVRSVLDEKQENQ
jgi:PAS domain S-box-containing protein